MELTDKNYYDKASSLEYLSVSLFKEFMKCEAAAYAELKGEWLPERDETPLLVGNYIHSYFESPEAHEAFLDRKDAKGVSNRDKMLNKRIKKEKVLKKDFKVADTLIERMAADNNFMQLYGAGDKEVIVTGEINGIKWKGKIDSLRLDLGKFFDIKTNKDLHGKNWVFKDGRNLPTTFVEAYGYHLQMALYRELIFQQFGVSCEPVIFGISKQDPPELMTIHFETEEMQDLLYDGLATIQEYQEHIKAVILQQIHYWLERSTNIKDGYKWVYNSMTEWHKQFPWLAIATLKRKFKSLEDKGLLITGNYNKAKFDKTKWYRINYDALDEMKQRLYQNDTTRVSNCTNGEYQNDTTNTIDYQENTSEKVAAVGEQEEVSNEADIFGEVQACGIQITPFNQQLLVDYIQKLKPELIVYAAQQTSVSAKHPNFNYFKEILERYIQLGFESVEEAKELEAKFEANKQQRSRSYTKKPTSGKSKWGGQLNEYDVTF